jgi:hypothetical protein
MNPVLLKPTGERMSQVVVMGQARGVFSAAAYHELKVELRPVVLDALAALRQRFDVVVCEGAGGAAEINLLERGLANLPLAAAAGVFLRSWSAISIVAESSPPSTERSPWSPRACAASSTSRRAAHSPARGWTTPARLGTTGPAGGERGAR